MISPNLPARLTHWVHYRNLWREARTNVSRRLNRKLMRSCAKAYARNRGWAIGYKDHW